MKMPQPGFCLFRHFYLARIWREWFPEPKLVHAKSKCSFACKAQVPQTAGASWAQGRSALSLLECSRSNTGTDCWYAGSEIPNHLSRCICNLFWFLNSSFCLLEFLWHCDHSPLALSSSGMRCQDRYCQNQTSSFCSFSFFSNVALEKKKKARCVRLSFHSFV